jgi:ABC-type Na+ efflux pump permease subunit
MRGEIAILRILRALGLAFVMAILAAIIGSFVAPVEQVNVFSSLFFIVGLIGFFILLVKAQEAGFWFCLCFAIEWALLPVAAAINVAQPQTSDQSGCAVLAGAIVAIVFLYISIPVGAIGFILFFLLAMLVFRKRKKKAPVDKPDSEEPGQR